MEKRLQASDMFQADNSKEFGIATLVEKRMDRNAWFDCQAQFVRV